MDPFTQAVEKIIKQQEAVIGPLAIEQAKKVQGLKFSGGKFAVQGNRSKVLEDLVKQYSHLFGRASVEVCKDAVQPLLSKIPAQEVPSLLK